MVHHLKVLVPGLLVAAVLALFSVASQGSFVFCAQLWAFTMGGPILATAFGATEYHPFLNLGWFGLPLMLAHPLLPNPWTAALTLIGVALWVFIGHVTVALVIFGP